MTKKKLKTIKVDRETYKIMEKIWAPRNIPYEPTIIKDKLFITTAEEVKEDGRQTEK